MASNVQCPHRFKCITQPGYTPDFKGVEAAGTLALYDVSNKCLRGQCVKFTHYIPNQRPAKIRARIFRVDAGYLSSDMVIVCHKVKLNDKWMGAERLEFKLKDIRMTQPPKLCEDALNSIRNVSKNGFLTAGGYAQFARIIGEGDEALAKSKGRTAKSATPALIG